MNEQDLYKRVVKPEVVISPFFTWTKEGELIFYPDFPCPKCDGYQAGDFAGSFHCSFCGFDTDTRDSLPHGESYLLECTWKFFRLFIHYKRLRWETSRLLYKLYSHLMWWYKLGRHKAILTVDNYMYNWKEKKWIKFM